MLYFGYGSNLKQERMKGRCKTAQKLGNAVLKDYELVFQENNNGRIVANIRECVGSEVVGVLYFTRTKEDRQALDRAEGHPYVYKRQYVEVEMDNGNIVTCNTYIMEDEFKKYDYVPMNLNDYKFKKKKYYVRGFEKVTRGYGIPELDYLRYIIEGYEENGLGDAWDIKEIFNDDRYNISNLTGIVPNSNTGGLVFTYGSLKDGYHNDRFLEDAEYVGVGFIDSHSMYSVGSFPAVVEGNGVVYGEVYKVDDDIVKGMDYLEGYNEEADDGIYLRRDIEVNLLGEEELVNTEYYIWNRDTNRLISVPYGVWSEDYFIR